MPETGLRKRRRKPHELPGRRETLRLALAPPERLTVSTWAERNRVLGEESAEPGRWRNWRFPYLIGVMDAFNDSDAEVIVFCAAAQCGKTEALLNCLGFAIDQAPGTVLLVYPSEKDSDKMMGGRLRQMILTSPAVRRHLPGNSDDLGLKAIRLDRMTIWGAWSNSPGALASTPCQYVLLDEVDKFPAYSGKEANPIKLAAVRTRTFVGRRKILIPSTPTIDTGYIWGEWERSDQNRYWVPCIHCGAFQVLDFFQGIRWEKDCPISDIRDKGLAWYECERCHERIPDERKGDMVACGKWAPHGIVVNDQGELEGEAPRGRRRGFHINALYSPFVSFGEVVVEFLESKNQPDLLQNFFNSTLALPWREKVESVTEAKIRATRRTYPAGLPPQEARILTAGVDVQGDVLWFVVRAWGVGERSWLIRHGFVTSWEELAQVLGARYGALAIERAFVDSGFRTEEVYEFTRKHRPVTWPSKGSNNPALVTSMRTSKPDPSTLLWTFKADYYKDKLSRLINTKPGEPGEWTTHQEIEDEYVRQMTSERRVVKRGPHGRTLTWEPLTEGTPNHLWDCEVLAVLAADSLGVRYLEIYTPSAGTAGPPAAPRRERDREDGWLQDKESDWLTGGSIWDG
jgi:phage terminase large subunit GpA-like protein